MTEAMRRRVLENPDGYPCDVLADAWAMTAQQVEARGPAFAWALRIAEREERKYRAFVRAETR